MIIIQNYLLLIILKIILMKRNNIWIPHVPKNAGSTITNNTRDYCLNNKILMLNKIYLIGKILNILFILKIIIQITK